MTAAAAPPMPAQEQKAATANSYIGPLTGVDHGTEACHFDPVAYSRGQYERGAQTMQAFQVRTRPQAEAWQKKLHTKLKELVGCFPAEPVPLRRLFGDPRVSELPARKVALRQSTRYERASVRADSQDARRVSSPGDDLRARIWDDYHTYYKRYYS